ncbi:MAG: hypothetical protein Q9190_000648 [Brigantiaea leucoxantha]
MTFPASILVPAGLPILGRASHSIRWHYQEADLLARLLLNFKGIDYKTVWLEYPDIAPTFQSYSISPNEEGTPYTIPTVRLPNGEYVMDSIKIAAKLEQAHPSPSLHLDSPLVPKASELIGRLLEPIVVVVFSKVPEALLNETSSEYFQRREHKRFGVPLEEVERTTDEGKAWEDATPILKECGCLLKAHGGPFFLGTTRKKYPKYLAPGSTWLTFT